MNVSAGRTALLVTAALLAARPAAAVSDAWDLGTVRSNACLVADYYLEHNPYDTKMRSAALEWQNGALWNGVTAFALSDPGTRYHDFMVKFGADQKWGYHESAPYHADTHCVGQAYLELAMADEKPAYAAPFRQLFDFIAFTAPATNDALAWGASDLRRWKWCDALFMSPTVFSRLAGFTGEEKYRDFFDAEYRATTAFLFDNEDKLFHRDSSFFGHKCPNGKTVYWSRGNGWVFGSLAIILRDAPKDWKSRGWYEDLFRTLAASLKACQTPDGSWHSSLLDPDHPAGPEMSGTCFFTYGMLWGMNNGILDEKEYEPVVKRAWAAIAKAVDDQGLLGYMQKIDAKPNATPANAQAPYGVGAYLCAAVELKTYIVRHAHPAAKTVEVTNPAGFFRPAETIALKLADLGFDGKDARVYDLRNGAFLAHQLFDSDGDGKMDQLLFSTYLLARGTRSFLVFADAAAADADNAKVCDAHACPYRLDDFAWENDRAAYRIYGFGVSQKPPKGEGLVSSGVDVYCKCVSYPVMEKWLKAAHYHQNHGEGMDNYKVGTGRGCGGIAAYDPAKRRWSVSGNWVPGTDKVLATGPVRAVFEVQYKGWLGSGTPETRRVTIDRGQDFAKMEATVDGLPEGSLIGPGMDVSAGHKHFGEIRVCPVNGWIANFEPADGANGSILTGVILAPGYKPTIERNNKTGDLMLLTKPADGRLVWYCGGGWDQVGHARTPCEWTARVRGFSAGLRNPPAVTVR